MRMCDISFELLRNSLDSKVLNILHFKPESILYYAMVLTLTLIHFTERKVETVEIETDTDDFKHNCLLCLCWGQVEDPLHLV